MQRKIVSRSRGKSYPFKNFVGPSSGSSYPFKKVDNRSKGMSEKLHLSKYVLFTNTSF